MSEYHCIFAERLITNYGVSHARLFRETIDGDRYPMFPSGQANIVIDDNGNYRVLTAQKEVLFIGNGYNEALARVKYAQPNADITVYYRGDKYTAEDYADKLQDPPSTPFP